MKKLLLIFSITTIGSLSSGANEGYVGNGGDIVFCSSGMPFTNELLDYHERKVFFPETVFDFEDDEQTIDEKVQRFIDKIKTFDPGRAKAYEVYFTQFYDEIIFTSDDLEDIPDSKHVSLPVGCDVKQAVIQFQEGFGVPGKRYLIDSKIWNSIEDNVKVGLVLHELIYRGAVKSGHRDSIATRALTSFVSSTAFNQISKKDYLLFLRKNNLSEVERYPGLILDRSKNTEYSKDGQILKAEFKPGSKIDLFGQEFIFSRDENVLITFKDNAESQISEVLILSEDGLIEFESDGTVFKTQEMIFSEDSVLIFQRNNYIKIFDQFINTPLKHDRDKGRIITLNPETGEFIKIFFGSTLKGMNEHGEVSYRWEGQDLTVGLSHFSGSLFGIIDLAFYNSNTLASGWIKNESIRLPSGLTYKLVKFDNTRNRSVFPKGLHGFSDVQFDKNGNLKEFRPIDADFVYQGKSYDMIQGKLVTLSPNGTVVGGTLWEDIEVRLGNGRFVKVLGRKKFEVYDNMTLKSASLLPDENLETRNGPHINCRTADFDKEGFATSCNGETLK